MDKKFRAYSQDVLPIDHVHYLEKVLHKYSILIQILYLILVLQFCIGNVTHIEFGKMLKYIVLTQSVHREYYMIKQMLITLCCLGDEDNCSVTWYGNPMFGGNSYYKEKK